jgi:hypothetical protein
VNEVKTKEISHKLHSMNTTESYTLKEHVSFVHIYILTDSLLSKKRLQLTGNLHELTVLSINYRWL